MSGRNTGAGVSDRSMSRKFSGILNQGAIRISIDLVAAARRHLLFLRNVADCPCLHDDSTLHRAVRRYDVFWMPLLSDLSRASQESPMFLPPIDVQWVWHCHCLNPESYRRYCEARCMTLVEKPAIFCDENEEYAEIRCRELWEQSFPSEPFDLEANQDGLTGEPEGISDEYGIFEVVSTHKALLTKFSEPFLVEIVYLIAARHRYRGFLHLLQECREGSFRLVPTCDILLMWLTHQSFPSTYAADVEELEGLLGRVVGIADSAKEDDVKVTKKLWETTFDQPYEKAGAVFDGSLTKRPPIFWDDGETDVNRKYKALSPRFILEVCVFLKAKLDENDAKDAKKMILRLRMVRCPRDLKMDKAVSDISSASWHKSWHLYCEFGTRGFVLELRQPGGACLRGSKLRKTTLFLWTDLSRAASLTLQRDVDTHMEAVASITPPVQGPYLLKCVPDRVTDDSGAMISDVILRMNQYRPQEGRWLSRTVLDHAGRECFVIRIRVGGGIWRRGAETPAAVRWKERIIEIREGPWSYLAGSVGKAPAKVVGTAVPRDEDSDDEKATWCLSTGHVLTIQYDERGLSFNLQNGTSDDDSEGALRRGRQLRYQCDGRGSPKSESDEEEEGFVTIIRYTSEKPNGSATALLNWKLLAVEVSPQEDAVMVLLICMAIVRSVSEFRKEDVGRLLVRSRERQAKPGRRDWGSVMLHPSSSSSSASTCSVPLQPWFWHSKEVFATPENDYTRPQIRTNYPTDGGDGLYKRGIVQRI